MLTQRNTKNTPIRKTPRVIHKRRITIIQTHGSTSKIPLSSELSDRTTTSAVLNSQQQQQKHQQQEMDTRSPTDSLSQNGQELISSFVSIPDTEPRNSTQHEEMVPSSILDRMNMLEQEQKVQAGKLQYMQKLIEENEKLRTELAEARSQITKLQLAISSDVTPNNTPSDNPDTDLLMTGTIESRHAPSYKEWEQRKLELEEKKKNNQHQDQLRQQKQLAKIDQQQQQPQSKHQKHQLKATPSYANMTSKNVTPKKKTNMQPPSEKLLNWAHRIFQPASDVKGYTIVYIPSPNRTLHSEVRKALRLLNIQHERIIDIHFPAHGVVGLLIHASYEKELRSLLSQAKITPKDTFNPTASSTIGDPELLKKLNEDERATEAKKLHQERMLAICLHMPKKHLGVAVIRYFASLPTDNPLHIGEEYWNKFQEKNPKPRHRSRQFLVSSDDARQLFSEKHENMNDGSKPMEEDNQ